MTTTSVPLRAIYRRVEERGRSDLALLSVYRDFGVVPREGREDNFNKASEDLSTYKVVRPGDLVLNKMKTWQGSLGVSAYEGIVSPAYFVGRRIADVNDRYMHHLLRSAPLIAQYSARSKGIRPSQWDLPWDEFASIKVALPARKQQLAIADYLDAETARIDALIAKKQRLVELLEERMVSLSHEMVTGTWADFGARRRTQDWLGPIPTDWPFAPVGSQFSVVLGRMLNPERASGEDLKPYVRNANVRWDFVDVTDIAEMQFPFGERAKYVLKNGDLLINEGGAGVGRSAIWREELSECYFQKSVLRLRPLANTRPEWMVECMRVAVAQNVLLVEGNLATIPHIPAEALRPMRFPFPPAAIQDALLARLQSERYRDQKLSENLQVQIDLLQERRQALITAAVTGQLDIPEVVHGNH